MRKKEKALLVFQTDFTYKEGAVCAMYGVVKSVDRELEILDGTHEIPKFDTWSASYRLYQSMKFWPKGTVFVSVVDPGVGTHRKACVAKTKDGYYVVTPDNGSLTHLVANVGIVEVREIDEAINRLKGYGTEGVSIFHGRDLFAYCGARLASGIISYQQVGETYPVEEILCHTIFQPLITQEQARGSFEIDDPNFGNIWTNIPTEAFLAGGFEYGQKLEVVIRHKEVVRFQDQIRFDDSFGRVHQGQALIYNNELMKLALAINQGNFIKEYNISYGPEWTIEISKGEPNGQIDK